MQRQGLTVVVSDVKAQVRFPGQILDPLPASVIPVSPESAPAPVTIGPIDSTPAPVDAGQIDDHDGLTLNSSPGATPSTTITIIIAAVAGVLAVAVTACLALYIRSRRKRKIIFSMRALKVRNDAVQTFDQLGKASTKPAIGLKTYTRPAPFEPSSDFSITYSQVHT